MDGRLPVEGHHCWVLCYVIIPVMTGLYSRQWAYKTPTIGLLTGYSYKIFSEPSTVEQATRYYSKPPVVR